MIGEDDDDAPPARGKGRKRGRADGLRQRGLGQLRGGQRGDVFLQPSAQDGADAGIGDRGVEKAASVGKTDMGHKESGSCPK